MQQKNIYTRNSKHFLDVESDTGKPIAKTEKSPSQELLNLWNPLNPLETSLNLFVNKAYIIMIILNKD